MKNIYLRNISINSLINISLDQKKIFLKKGINNIHDLLLYFIPLRYEDYRKISKINVVIPNNVYIIKGTVINCKKIIKKNRYIFLYKIKDESGDLFLRFFYFSPQIKKTLFIGATVTFYGKIIKNFNQLEIIHPKFLMNNKDYLNIKKKSIIPIYPKMLGISQNTIKFFIKKALNLLKEVHIKEIIPEFIKNNLIDFSSALREIHQPSIDLYKNTLKENIIFLAKKRLILEEILAYHLHLIFLKKIKQQYKSIPFFINKKSVEKFISNLPFQLTNAQKKVINEINQDLKNDFPMYRLIQGEVGSGKTLIAAITALNVILHGKQVALMVPTELLVEQHKKKFLKWFLPFNIKIVCLTGKQNKKIRQEQYHQIASGYVLMIIGTQALLQKKVIFKNLSLIIIDEDHRFGVNQRFSILEKSEYKKKYPHQLMMTATPIPRTINMVSFEYINISIIKELPKNRLPIVTVIIPDIRRKKLINRIKKILEKGQQIYWICTSIIQSKSLNIRDLEITLKELKNLLPQYNIGILHGKMKDSEKKNIMFLFKKNFFQLLVTTTIIEVGIDIPNVSLIIIENSERLGLSQLHQLRGRVGRGSHQSYCIMLYKHPLNEIAKKRFKILKNYNSGFEIAKYDLEHRGFGDFLGTRQTGFINFKVANPFKHRLSFLEMKKTAFYIYKKFPNIAQEILNRWYPNIKNFF
ncbi:ATP-dependent DNA helicase RecG [Candidatus Tachikawaea gelatinosa]|uniref:ATP-dependent DNA helicase RecG n=1 Tax=Candidatus Tachikawaea gelatinosa TaxID=1410383 RepID=A0A090BWK7_9ENTR|nr:ATP-dependent DNA helicase RecG [Candidatus Tachikawaea gelatinosa]BAP58776.1 ATP-dependent DNA helicase RecG [Candidatus Tachikawaea gelatinosa]